MTAEPLHETSAPPPPAVSAEVKAIEFLRTRSLSTVVQAEVERMIVDGDLTPNERINEVTLAKRLGVSRGPIREACSALAAIGLIEIIPNRGFFVRELSPEEAMEVSEARAGVFGCLVMILAERATDEHISALRDLLAQMEAIVPTGEVSRYYPINLAFHAALASMGGNRRLEQSYQSFVRELHIQRYRALSSADVLEVSNAEHRAIVDAVAARDPERAFSAARSHILNGAARTRLASKRRLS